MDYLTENDKLDRKRKKNKVEIWSFSTIFGYNSNTDSKSEPEFDSICCDEKIRLQNSDSKTSIKVDLKRI